MTRWNGPARFVPLMNGMGWKGKTDWDTMSCQPELLEFAEWLRYNEHILLEDDVREVFHSHYFTDEKGDKNRGYFFKLDQSRTAMIAAYTLEQGRRQDVSMLKALLNNVFEQIKDLEKLSSSVATKRSIELLIASFANYVCILNWICHEDDTQDMVVFFYNAVRLCIEYSLYSTAYELCEVFRWTQYEVDAGMEREFHRWSDIAYKEVYKKHADN